MITREQIHELAQFEDQSSCALSFYYQPSTPRNKAHKEDAIYTRDLARNILHQIESKNETNGARLQSESARDDLERILRLSQDLRSNGSHAKGVFACSAHNFWREFDLPAHLSSTQLTLDRHFHLRPLAKMLGALPSLGVVLIDRHRARLFEFRLGEVTERQDFFHSLPPRGRSDGFAGYDAGHAERHAADEVRQHFKTVAEVVKEWLEKGIFENWIVGCQETLWPQFSQQLHSYASQKLLGRFPAEVGHATNDEIRAQADRIVADWQQERCDEALRETIDQARSNGRGVTGLRRVLRALEMGEIQTLLISEHYAAQAVECSGCGHLDAHLVHLCPACGRETRKLVDVGEAILPWVIRHNIELFYVKNDAEFDQVGNIAALLRFRPVERPWPVKHETGASGESTKLAHHRNWA